MNSVLVYGLKDPVGGVEHAVMEYVRNMTSRFDITFDFLCFSDSFSLEKEITGLGCRVINIPNRKKNPVRYKKAIAQLFRDNTYCAIWANYSGLSNIDVLILGKKHAVPVRIAHSHVSRLYWGSPIMKYVVKFLHGYNKHRVKQYANVYLACSRLARNFMFPEEVWQETMLIRNAVDIERFHPDADNRQTVREKFGFEQNQLIVGHVARLCEVKNQGFLLKIMAQLICEKPDAMLLLVGDGELRGQLEAQAAELGIEDHVIFTGSRRDIPDLLHAMDVYVLTSFSEGLSVSTVEAQACGLPCVLSATVSEETDISGVVDFISLKESSKVWADAIVRQSKRKVLDPTEQIACHGYEISNAAENMYRILTGDKV